MRRQQELLSHLRCELPPWHRNPLLYLFSLFRLISVIESALTGSLSSIDAMLGCPLALFPMVRGSAF